MAKLDPAVQAKLKKYFEMFRGSFGEFCRFFGNSYFTSGFGEFHKEIFDLLSKQRVVLATPRGHGKSTIASVYYPLWLALFGLRKEICIISASETLAVDFLRKIKKEVETNKDVLGLWGDMRSDKWAENHIIFKNGVNVRARGAGGQIRGFRPDCLILDDIETNESVESEEQRKKLKDWIFKDCLNTLLPHGQFIVIGTIIHPLSVLADLLVADNGWDKRKYQAYKDGREEEGYELWGQLWNHKRLQERKREIGSWAFASEYMNNPVADETRPIKEDMIRYWKELPTQYSAVISVDPAYSDDEHADWKVASLIFMDSLSNRYLVNYVRTHAPIGDFQDSIINMWLQNRGAVTAIGIPSGGVEKSFFDSFLRKCDERKLYPPVFELKNTFTNSVTNVSVRNKKARVVASLQPLFEQGKYYIHSNHIEVRDELLTIGSSRWDDIVDTMAYAEQIVTPAVFQEEKRNSWEEEQVFLPNYGMG